MITRLFAVVSTGFLLGATPALVQAAAGSQINPNHMFLLQRDMINSTCPPEWLSEHKLTAQECTQKLGRAKHHCATIVVGDRTTPFNDAESGQDVLNYNLCQIYTFWGCEFNGPQLTKFVEALQDIEQHNTDGRLPEEKELAVGNLLEKACPNIAQVANE